MNTRFMKDVNDEDVLLGRGPFCYRHPGNIAFRNLIQDHVANYARCAPRQAKKKIVQKLISKAQKQGSRFLVRDKDSGDWCQAHPYLVEAKVSHALRDARHSKRLVPLDSTADLSKSSQNDEMLKARSNGKQVFKSSQVDPTNSKGSMAKGNHIPLIDPTLKFPFGDSETLLVQARRQSRDLIGCGTIYQKKSIEIPCVLTAINEVNAIPFMSPALRYVL
jgi:hypothetical protein